MEEQSCVLLENGQTDQRICIAAAIYERNRPDPGIKNRQAPCGACRVMVRVVIQNFLKKPVISTVFKADE